MADQDTKPSMSWDQVAASEKFQSASPETQKAVRDQYFDKVVTPKLEKAGKDVDAAKSQFIEHTDKTIKSPGTLAAIGREAKGAGEAALSVASGMAGQVAGSAYGVAKAVTGGHYGTQQGVEEGEKAGVELANKMTYQPKSHEGQRDLEALGKAFDASKLEGLPPEHAFAAGLVGPEAAKGIAKQVAKGVDATSATVNKMIEGQSPKAVANIFDRMSQVPKVAGTPGGEKMKAASDMLRNMTPEQIRAQINNGNSTLHQAVTEFRKSQGVVARSSKAAVVDALQFYAKSPKEALAEMGSEIKKAGVEGFKTGSAHNLIKSKLVDKLMPNASEEQKSIVTWGVQGALAAVGGPLAHAEELGAVLGPVAKGVTAGVKQVLPSFNKAMEKVAVKKLVGEEEPVRYKKPTLKDALQPKQSPNTPGASPSVSQQQQLSQQPQAQATAPQVIKLADHLPQKQGLQVEKNYDGGFTAKVPGDNRAMIMLQHDGKGVDVSDVFRGNQPKGSAGDMLAETIKKSGKSQPEHIKISKISETQPTIDQLRQGADPGDTVLGKTVINAAKKLGGKVTGWKVGKDNRDKPFIKAEISYNQGKSE